MDSEELCMVHESAWRSRARFPSLSLYSENWSHLYWSRKKEKRLETLILGSKRVGPEHQEFSNYVSWQQRGTVLQAPYRSRALVWHALTHSSFSVSKYYPHIVSGKKSGCLLLGIGGKMLVCVKNCWPLITTSRFQWGQSQVYLRLHLQSVWGNFNRRSAHRSNTKRPLCREECFFLSHLHGADWGPPHPVWDGTWVEILLSWSISGDFCCWSCYVVLSMKGEGLLLILHWDVTVSVVEAQVKG